MEEDTGFEPVGLFRPSELATQRIKPDSANLPFMVSLGRVELPIYRFAICYVIPSTPQGRNSNGTG